MATSHSTADVATDAQLDAVFSALADPTRRRLLSRLSMGGASISELAEPFAMTLPAVSKHVRVLERAGLVQRQRNGRVHDCRFDGRPLGDAAAFIREYSAFWEDNLDQLAAYLEGKGDAPD